ncbi:MAG: GNAT family N-acetyltransferase [Candidatus ainarchaeum sp.]|nr:GNAT family N-acetyltransferase [Candidatus ainarchaeum sp.]
MNIINFNKKYSKQLSELWLSPEITKNTLSTKTRTTPKNLTKKLLKEKQNSFLAIENKNVIGFSSLRPFEGRKNHSADFVIFVSPNYHRKGVGTKLMKKLFDRTKKLKLKRIELSVFSDNKKAISFYKKFGFKIDGKKKKSLQRDQKLFDEIIMGKLI